jgi:hypothetical protein
MSPNFNNAAQARRWFVGHLPQTFSLLVTLFIDLRKAYQRPSMVITFKTNLQHYCNINVIENG